MNLLEKIIAGTIIVGSLTFAGCESKSYSTPQRTVETFVKASKKKDVKTVLTSMGYDKEVIDYIVNEDKRVYNHCLRNDCCIEESIEVETLSQKYNIYFGEEISVIKTEVKKGKRINDWYWFLVNDEGKWRIIKWGNTSFFKSLWKKGYNDPKSSEIKKSKLLEMHKNGREGSIEDYLRNRKK